MAENSERIFNTRFPQYKCQYGEDKTPKMKDKDFKTMMRELILIRYL